MENRPGTVEGTDDEPDGRVAAAYDALAERADELDPAASPWRDSHFQRHYSWPATRRVLPELEGASVLLAGCGRGDYVPWYRERGATVTGVDVSETAIEHARERFGDEATFRRADLAEPLAFDDGSFDLVVSNLVFSHIEEWRPVLETFERVATAGGVVVVTTVHPRYVRAKGDVANYYAVEEVTNEWPGVEMPTFYRPMEAVVGPFLEAGLRLERFDEPTPETGYAEHAPERYREALREPELLVVRARTS